MMNENNSVSTAVGCRGVVAARSRIPLATIALIATSLLLSACSTGGTEIDENAFGVEPPAEQIVVVRGEQTTVGVSVTRDPGFEEVIDVTAILLPDGVTASSAPVLAGEATSEFTLTAEAGAELGVAEIEIDASAAGAGVSEAAELLVKDPAGTLDETFSGDGSVLVELGGSVESWGMTVAIQDDGKVVFAGGASESGGLQEWVVGRLNEDGTRDTSFGDNGVVITESGANSAQPSALVIQEDGKILVAGYFRTGTNRDAVLLRYLADGQLDDSFGTNGMVTYDSTDAEEATSLVSLPSGKILMAGVITGVDRDFAVWRFEDSGDIDLEFGQNGVRQVDFGGSDSLYGLAVAADGAIFAVGQTYDGVFDAAIARLDSNGDLATGFNGDGKLKLDYEGALNVGRTALVQDGSLLVGGNADSGSSRDFWLARVAFDGTLDKSFGTDGSVLTDFAGLGDSMSSLAIQEDGRIVAAGTAEEVTDGDGFALARYTADGQLDVTFETNGKVLTQPGEWQDSSYGLALGPLGRITVAGWVTVNVDFIHVALARYWQ